MLAWLSLIFDFSSQTYSEQSIIPYLQSHISEHRLQQIVPNLTIHYDHSRIQAKSDPYHFVEFLFRKSAHLFMYAMLGLFSLLALWPWISRLRTRLLLAVMLVILFASLDEWNQSRTGDRTPTILDVGVDTTGAIIGLVFFLLAYTIVRQIRRKRLPMRRSSLP